MINSQYYEGGHLIKLDRKYLANSQSVRNLTGIEQDRNIYPFNKTQSQ